MRIRQQYEELFRKIGQLGNASEHERKENGEMSDLSENGKCKGETRKKSKSDKHLSFYASGSEVKRALACRQSLFVLVYKESLLNSNDLTTSVPSVVSKLLQEYKDLFPEEIPKYLPLIHGIEHQIDFVPRVSIADRPAYRCNPEETKEIQKQVQELMEKVYVRESMSPCDVPILIIPKKDGTWMMCVDCHAINKIMIGMADPPVPTMAQVMEFLKRIGRQLQDFDDRVERVETYQNGPNNNGNHINQQALRQIRRGR
eukprot:XP_015580036.1 uncharacterized protein LOC107261953 [Ricinus communis]